MTTSSTGLTAANRAFFDDLAAKYDMKPWQKQVSLQITNYIQQNLDFVGIPSTQTPLPSLTTPVAPA